MYAQLMKNLSQLNFSNGELSCVTQLGHNIEDQKPFLIYNDTINKKQYLAFVYGGVIYVTMFRSANSGITSRLRTVIDKLDKSTQQVDLAMYLARNGIPLKTMSFGKNEILLTEINLWEAMFYKYNAGTQIERLLRDLRDLLYV